MNDININIKIKNIPNPEDYFNKSYEIFIDSLNDIININNIKNNKDKYKKEKIKLMTNIHHISEIYLSGLILEKNPLDLIKIDTEGHEYEVLYGTGDYIKKINYILVEFHVDNIYENYNPDKIHNLLLENGFTLQKKFSFPFPFTTWEDRLYKNSKFLN